MKVIIDRFEGIYAICEKEDKSMLNIKKIDIPNDAKEGYILNIEGNTITIDKNETKRRKKEIEEITKNLWD